MSRFEIFSVCLVCFIAIWNVLEYEPVNCNCNQIQRFLRNVKLKRSRVIFQKTNVVYTIQRFFFKSGRAGPHPIGQKGQLVKRSLGPKSQILNPKYRIPGHRSQTTNPESQILNPKSKFPDSKSKIHEKFGRNLLWPQKNLAEKIWVKKKLVEKNLGHNEFGLKILCVEKRFGRKIFRPKKIGIKKIRVKKIIGKKKSWVEFFLHESSC